MNDRSMGELVRMAMEVDELEREPSSAAPRLRLVGGEGESVHPLPTRRWWIGMTAAAAAILTMAAALPLMMRPPVKVEPAIADKIESPLPVAPVELRSATVETVVRPSAPATAPVDAGSIERCVVVAIYRNNRGGLDCVSPPTPQVWQGNKCLSEVSAQELKTLTLDRACSPRESDRALVVAMAGPQRSLPKTESDAMGLATCILGGPDEWQGLRAESCVPPEVAVKIEALGSR
jgi:hypothetical protein